MIRDVIKHLISNGAPYKPEDMGKAPETMRELIKSTIDSNSDYRVKTYGLTSLRPVRSGFVNVYNIDRPVSPPVDSDKYKHCIDFFKAWHSWLKSNKMLGGVDLDHQLDGDAEKWPIVERFSEVLADKTSYSIEDVGLGDLFFQDESDDLYIDFWPPVYLYDYTDTGPLFELFESIRYSIQHHYWVLDFPEACHEVAGNLNLPIDECLKKFTEILKDRNLWGIMGREWKGSIESLSNYGEAVAYYDEGMEPIHVEDENDVDWLFSFLSQLAAMHSATGGLVWECTRGSYEFWKKYLEELVDVEIEQQTKVACVC